MTDTLFFDSLYIVEWLGLYDPKTGTNLADALAYEQNSVPVVLKRAFTREEFLGILWDILAECSAKHQSPILHIETHGNPDWIGLDPQHEYVTWAEMKGVLVEINAMSRLNLLVVMAACDGAHLVRVVHPTERAPVWGIVGPPKPLTPEEFLRDFPPFYRELFHSRDGRRALEVLNGKRVGEPWRYHYYPVRFFFRYAYHRYLTEQTTGSVLQEREDSIVRLVTGGRPEPTGLRDQIRAMLCDHQMHFQQHRRHFFMIDRYAENDQRFPLTIADCQRDPASDVV